MWEQIGTAVLAVLAWLTTLIGVCTLFIIAFRRMLYELVQTRKDITDKVQETAEAVATKLDDVTVGQTGAIAKKIDIVATAVNHVVEERDELRKALAAVTKELADLKQVVAVKEAVKTTIEDSKT